MALINELSVTELMAVSDPELKCQFLPKVVTTKDKAVSDENEGEVILPC